MNTTPPNFSQIVPVIVKRALEYQSTLPTKADAQRFAEGTLQALFPRFLSSDQNCCEDDTERQLMEMFHLLVTILEPLEKQVESNVQGIIESRSIAINFFQKISGIYETLWLDAEALYQGDPAAESIEEVILAYPGFHATAVYRIANVFYRQKVPILPRLLSEYAHSATGIDIHPGASIGERFCIDHGTGVVIGETTTIGSNVKIYQGVTLGALSVKKSLAETKRHPTIEDNVVIYSNATILGGQTVIGANSIIGGNVWLTQSIPAGSLVFNTSKIRIQNSDTVSDQSQASSLAAALSEELDFVI